MDFQVQDLESHPLQSNPKKRMFLFLLFFLQKYFLLLLPCKCNVGTLCFCTDTCKEKTHLTLRPVRALQHCYRLRGGRSPMLIDRYTLDTRMCLYGYISKSSEIHIFLLERDFNVDLASGAHMSTLRHVKRASLLGIIIFCINKKDCFTNMASPRCLHFQY